MNNRKFEQIHNPLLAANTNWKQISQNTFQAYFKIMEGDKRCEIFNKQRATKLQKIQFSTTFLISTKNICCDFQ